MVDFKTWFQERHGMDDWWYPGELQTDVLQRFMDSMAVYVTESVKATANEPLEDEQIDTKGEGDG